ncbi:unnamed protein product [Lepeophtheirus salmonis]|uniref:(salmon louse) hypothetical protein n=1 Tax=Lepeophtheirus salmonis TaxID=72036 RepID=A0A7R8CWV5_LEPSM|nr:unnamed protein product [Lepeophtheirus salmonis]CAF2956084.1 unnamed protein product [Lepeophtheirus salmonis]
MATVSQVSIPIEAMGVIADSLSNLISSGTVFAIGGASPKKDRGRRTLRPTPFSPVNVWLSVGHIYLLESKPEHVGHGVNDLQKLEFLCPLLLERVADHSPRIYEYIPGKLSGHVATVTSGLPLIEVTHLSLIDTAATVSVISCKSVSSASITPSPLQLSAANGELKKVLGGNKIKSVYL